MTKDSPEYSLNTVPGFADTQVQEFNNPFNISPEVYALLQQVNDANREHIKNKIIELITKQHGSDQIQFLSAQSTLLQISVADWAQHLVLRRGNPESWYAPAGTSVCFVHDPERFVKVGDNEYVHRNLEAEKLGHVDYGIGLEPGEQGPDGKDFTCEAELRINGEVYNQSLEDILQSTDQQRLRERIRRDVIADLRRRWGGNTTEALDDQGYVVTLTAEQVADQAMEQHLDRGLQELDQPFSRTSTEKDTRTIYGQSARDMAGTVMVNGVPTPVSRNGTVTVDEISAGLPIDIQYGSLGRAWRPESALAKRSKTVHKPVRKVKLRDKARAQRRARKKSR